MGFFKRLSTGIAGMVTGGPVGGVAGFVGAGGGGRSEKTKREAPDKWAKWFNNKFGTNQTFDQIVAAGYDLKANQKAKAQAQGKRGPSTKSKGRGKRGRGKPKGRAGRKSPALPRIAKEFTPAQAAVFGGQSYVYGSGIDRTPVNKLLQDLGLTSTGAESGSDFLGIGSKKKARQEERMKLLTYAGVFLGIVVSLITLIKFIK